MTWRRESDNSQVGRGKRVPVSRERVMLGDSETRTHLPPLYSEREPLRRRYLALLARSATLRPHQRDLIERMEAHVVDEPDLDAAQAWLADLERLNERQLVGALRHHWERIS